MDKVSAVKNDKKESKLRRRDPVLVDLTLDQEHPTQLQLAVSDADPATLSSELTRK